MKVSSIIMREWQCCYLAVLKHPPKRCQSAVTPTRYTRDLDFLHVDKHCDSLYVTISAYRLSYIRGPLI